jgi:fido (protein-threonine AMPylation protein)
VPGRDLRVASYVHCEVIRIHPFVNGNGRVARLCLNYFARRYGMRAISFERTNGDYLDANRTWLDRRVIDHFVDFLRSRWIRRQAFGSD